MRNKLYLLLLCLATLPLLNSCSKNDDESPSSQTVRKVQRIFAVNTTQGVQNEYRFQYNEDNFIKSIVKISNQISFTALFEYEQNKMFLKITPSVGDVLDLIINYEDGIITSILINDESLPITYNTATASYTIFGSQLSFNQNGDVASFSGYIDFDYDESKKGAFYNIPSGTPQLIFLLFEEIYMSTVLSTKPVKSFDIGTDTLDFANTYDSQGYITSAVAGSISFEYQYFQ